MSGGFVVRPLGRGAYVLEVRGVPLVAARAPEDGARGRLFAALRRAGEAHAALRKEKDERRRARLLAAYREAVAEAQRAGEWGRRR